VIDPAAIAPERARPLRRCEYDRLVELGVFEGERIELLEGVLVAMTPQNAPHSGSIQRLNSILVPRLAGRAEVRVQLALAVSDDSEPEPDIAVVRPGRRFDEHPSTALLVIEVADASLRKDRGIKAALYARAGVPEYWIVDLPARVLEVHRDPQGDAYATVERHGRGETVPLLTFPDVAVDVAEIVP